MQLAMPRAEERAARDFFVGVLGMTEVDKPPVLAARGGAWFRAGDVELPLGVEDNFRPARKGHPGIRSGRYSPSQKPLGVSTSRVMTTTGPRVTRRSSAKPRAGSAHW